LFRLTFIIGLPPGLLLIVKNPNKTFFHLSANIQRQSCLIGHSHRWMQFAIISSTPTQLHTHTHKHTHTNTIPNPFSESICEHSMRWDRKTEQKGRKLNGYSLLTFESRGTPNNLSFSVKYFQYFANKRSLESFKSSFSN